MRNDFKPQLDEGTDSVRQAGFLLAFVGAILLVSILVISTMQLRGTTQQRPEISSVR
ncbi:MAG: hypothetical protein OEM52_08415 [bacterium]|nr:hypothetical protein [bacterium]